MMLMLGLGVAGDRRRHRLSSRSWSYEVMDKICNCEEPELQWMRWIGVETDHYVAAQAQCWGGGGCQAFTSSRQVVIMTSQTTSLLSILSSAAQASSCQIISGKLELRLLLPGGGGPRLTGRRWRGGRCMWSGSWWKRWRVSLGLWPGCRVTTDTARGDRPDSSSVLKVSQIHRREVEENIQSLQLE